MVIPERDKTVYHNGKFDSGKFKDKPQNLYVPLLLYSHSLRIRATKFQQEDMELGQSLLNCLQSSRINQTVTIQFQTRVNHTNLI